LVKGIAPGRYWPHELNWPEELGLLPLNYLEAVGRAKAAENVHGFMFIIVYKPVSAALHEKALTRAKKTKELLI
jgi:hypothetical protein